RSQGKNHATNQSNPMQLPQSSTHYQTRLVRTRQAMKRHRSQHKCKERKAAHPRHHRQQPQSAQNSLGANRLSSHSVPHLTQQSFIANIDIRSKATLHETLLLKGHRFSHAVSLAILTLKLEQNQPCCAHVFRRHSERSEESLYFVLVCSCSSVLSPKF